MNQRNQTVKEPGLMCPVCGKFIPTSVAELLSFRPGTVAKNPRSPATVRPGSQAGKQYKPVQPIN